MCFFFNLLIDVKKVLFVRCFDRVVIFSFFSFKVLFSHVHSKLSLIPSLLSHIPPSLCENLVFALGVGGGLGLRNSSAQEVSWELFCPGTFFFL